MSQAGTPDDGDGTGDQLPEPEPLTTTESTLPWKRQDDSPADAAGERFERSYPASWLELDELHYSPSDSVLGAFFLVFFLFSFFI